MWFETESSLAINSTESCMFNIEMNFSPIILFYSDFCVILNLNSGVKAPFFPPYAG